MHTPGKWKRAEAIDGNGGIRIFALNDAEVAPATVYGDTPEQRDANARLIAQSPELLETQRPYLMEDAAFALQAYMDENGENEDYAYVVEELTKLACVMRENLKKVTV